MVQGGAKSDNSEATLGADMEKDNLFTRASFEPKLSYLKKVYKLQQK